MYVCVKVCARRVEDNDVESVFSFHLYVGSRA